MATPWVVLTLDGSQCPGLSSKKYLDPSPKKCVLKELYAHYRASVLVVTLEEKTRTLAP